MYLSISYTDPLYKVGQQAIGFMVHKFLKRKNDNNWAYNIILVL